MCTLYMLTHIKNYAKILKDKDLSEEEKKRILAAEKKKQEDDIIL